MKDSKRIFSESDKNTIMLRQHGLCHDCGAAFDADLSPEFHHVVPHAKGGDTVPENGIAVCRQCHGVRHDADIWPLLSVYQAHGDPRYAWQPRNLFRVAAGLRQGQTVWAAEVSMGGGKTRWSVQAATLAMAKTGAGTTIILAPTVAICNDYCREIKALDPSARIYRKLNPSGGRDPRPPHDGYIVATYSAATSSRSHSRHVEWLQLWKDAGWRFVLVCDEVHHTSVMSTWGNVANVENMAEWTLVQTGTPFRSDENAMAIVPYVNAVPEVRTRYTVGQAIRDNVVRPVSFRWCDAELTYFERDPSGSVQERRVASIADIPKDLQAQAVNMAMEPGTPLFEQMYAATVEHLVATRRNPDTALAKCLLVCQPGKDQQEKRYIERLAKSWRRNGLASQHPWVVTSQDENSSDIATFRQDANAQYIAAINMISEGVNIPWLMVLGLFRCVGTEMLFHQLAGRVMRTTIGGNGREWGRVVLPRTDDHVAFAATLESQIPAAIRRDRCQTCGNVPCTCPPVDPSPVCPHCGQDPCICRRPARRLVDVIVEGSRLDGGFTGGDDVNEHWCQQGREVLGRLNRHGDEVYAGLLLQTGAEINVSAAGNINAGQAATPSREQELAHLYAAISQYARRANIATEDATRTVFRILGVDTEHDLAGFSVGDVREARSRVQELTAQEIRRQFS